MKLRRSTFKRYFEKKENSGFARATLKRQYDNLKAVINFSFTLTTKLPKFAELVSKDAQADTNVLAKYERLRQAGGYLLGSGNYEAYLLLALTMELNLSTESLKLVRFEDAQVLKDGKKVITIFDKTSGKELIRYPTSDLWHAFAEHKKNTKGNNHKYFLSRRRLNSSRSICGHFVFNKDRVAIARVFRTGFRGIVRDFAFTPREIISICARSKQILNSDKSDGLHKPPKCIHNAT